MDSGRWVQRTRIRSLCATRVTTCCCVQPRHHIHIISLFQHCMNLVIGRTLCLSDAVETDVECCDADRVQAASHQDDSPALTNANMIPLHGVEGLVT